MNEAIYCRIGANSAVNNRTLELSISGADLFSLQNVSDHERFVMLL